jgi:1,2-diacylglycerol 3-alpha-glucosyltransferase
VSHARPDARLAVVFHRFGPYHLARLEAAGAFCAGRGVELLGLECGRTDTVYAWDVVAGARHFRRVTLLDRGVGERRADPQVAAAVRGALDRERPDVVAIPGWSFASAVAALRWCTAHGAGAVLMSESARQDHRRVWLKEWIKRRRVRRFGAALVGGTPHADYAAELGLPRDRIFLGYDVVDNRHFGEGADAARADAPSRRAALSLPPRYFLASSRFVPGKNLSTLLDAFAAHRGRAGAGAWSLVLCGDGPLRDTLRQQALRLGIGSAVTFPGFVQYPDLPAYYGLASAFVHASAVEPWGLVVNEAMAAALPVLVSRQCGCAHDLVKDGENGFLFDPADSAALAETMRRLAGGGADLERMGRVSRQRIGEWTPDRFALGLWRAAVACRPEWATR